MNHRHTRLLANVTLAAGLGLASHVFAQTPTFDSILEGAKQEGRVVAVISSPGKPSLMRCWPRRSTSVSVWI
jgi:hypothetical protein